MITNDNTLSNKGDTVFFKTVPLFNVLEITSFNDDLTGVTSNRYCDKFFRFSIDGVVYSDYYDLTMQNIIDNVNSVIPNREFFIIQIMYIRNGSDNTGTITINELNFNCIYDYNEPSFEASKNTILKNLVNDDIDVHNLMFNLAQKLYSVGIVPLYMERNELENDLFEDIDYVDFWSSVAKLYSSIYYFSIKFTIIYWRKELLEEFLKQKSIQFCSNTSIITLQSIAKNYYDEIRQRGTVEIFRKKDHEYPIGYRKTYEIPNGFNIQPSNPIYIDDIRYNEIDELPYGWVLSYDQGLLIQPDNVNYHNVQILDYPEPIVIDSNWIDNTNDINRINLSKSDDLEPTRFSGIIRKYHGEYLRLICFCSNCDEFMYLVVNQQNFGWNIGNSSPLYKGLRRHYNNSIIKGYENFSENVWDLGYYPIIEINSYPIQTYRIKTNDDDILDTNDNGNDFIYKN